MSSKAQYRLDGRFLTEEEYLEHAMQRAQNLDEETRKAYLENFANLFNHKMETEKREKIINNYIIPGVGLLVLIALVIFIFYNPVPSTYQSGVYWILISLAAAASAAAIPGFFEFKYKDVVRATGAIGIFCLLYFYVPAVMDKDLSSGTHKLNLVVAKDDTISVQKIIFDFDPNSADKICDYTKKAMDSYLGTGEKDSFTFYRKSDGRIYGNEICREVREYDILAVSNSLLPHYSNKRDAYIHFIKLARSIEEFFPLQ